MPRHARHTLRLQVLGEPKIAADRWNVDRYEAVTDTGEVLASGNGPAAGGMPGSGNRLNGPGRQSTFSLSVAKPVASLKRLTLHARFMVVIRRKQLEIPDVLARRSRGSSSAGSRSCSSR